MGAKKKEKGPNLTPSRRGALQRAADNAAGQWRPYGSGEWRMARRLQTDGFGACIGNAFTINDAGRAAAKGGA